MPYKDKPIEKKYFMISEVADMMHQNQSTLRFWEDEFDWIHPKRNRKNNRQYKVSDIDDLMSISILLIVGGMTLEGVKKAYNMKYINQLKEFFIEKQCGYLPNASEILNLMKYPITYAESFKTPATSKKMPLDHYTPDPPCELP